MKHLEIPDLPDDLYAAIERRARASGRTPGAEAAAILVRSVEAEKKKEEELLAAIRKDRDEMARQGIFLTDEDIESAIGRRRK